MKKFMKDMKIHFYHTNSKVGVFLYSINVFSCTYIYYPFL